MVIPKGHMSFHHCRTYHGSGANRRDRPRRAISLHLQDGDNEYRPSPARRQHGGSTTTTTSCAAPPAGEPDYADPDFCPPIWSA